MMEPTLTMKLGKSMLVLVLLTVVCTETEADCREGDVRITPNLRPFYHTTLRRCSRNQWEPWQPRQRVVLSKREKSGSERPVVIGLGVATGVLLLALTLVTVGWVWSWRALKKKASKLETSSNKRSSFQSPREPAHRNPANDPLPLPQVTQYYSSIGPSYYETLGCSNIHSPAQNVARNGGTNGKHSPYDQLEKQEELDTHDYHELEKDSGRATLTGSTSAKEDQLTVVAGGIGGYEVPVN